MLLFAAAVYAQDADTIVFEGELNDRNPSETYTVQLEAGQLVTLTTNAQGQLDTLLTLFDPRGDQVAENDDYGDGFNSQIVYAAAETGAYTVEVSRFGASGSGGFTLTVESGVNAVAGLSADATILLNTLSTLDARHEEIKFPLELSAGDILVALTIATTPDLDTTLALLDEGGAEIAQNDDRGDGSLNSEIIYEIPSTGRYVIVLSRFSADVDGDAVVIVATDPNAEAPFNFTAVEGEILAEYSGSLDPSSSPVAYTVTLAAGESLYAYTQVTSGDLDTVLKLFGPEGTILTLNDDRGDDTYNSAFAYTAPVGGRYSVEVSRYEGSDSSGDYTLYLLRVDEAVAATITAIAERAVELSGPEQILETENFRIHYTIGGGDVVTDDYLAAFAETLETIYDIQINQMGWAPPPRNDDGLYDAYLTDVIGSGDGSLGFTRPTRFVGDNPNTPVVEQTASRSVLVVDNDFADMGDDANPLSLMRATTTHEFNHMIQFGYETSEPLDWLYESTASWIETATVGDEQDATGYVADSYTYPELCFATTEQEGDLAYGDWTLHESLARVHGERFIPRIWEMAAEHDGMEVMERALAEVGDTLPNALIRWRVQNFALDYDLAPLFGATVWLEETIDRPGKWTFTGAGIQESGANYFEFDLQGVYGLVLDGPAQLELWALGVRDGEVQAYRIGREGTFDSSGFEYVGLMVYNTDIPQDTSACSYVDYEIAVQRGRPGQTDTADAVFTFSAAEFRPLEQQ
jgi:hypothetical protein